jgi:serine/threonine protein phosphatase 1
MNNASSLPAASASRTATTPPFLRLYAVGDIHGRDDLLCDVLHKIDVDLAEAAGVTPLVVFVGDYVDRGPNSRRVIDLLIELEMRLPTVCLCGNHELYMLKFLREPDSGPQWFDLGGRETLTSYGLQIPAKLNGRVLADLSRRFQEALPKSHLQFLSSRPSSLALGDYLFVHGGVAAHMPMSEQSPRMLATTREESSLATERLGRVIVHGHTPVPSLEVRGGYINIDTGAYATGLLTCIALEGITMRVL